jgi:IMP cyclohydrolase
MIIKFGDVLRSVDYPGRGIFIGRSADNLRAVAAYFIMGRSENSRNRVFVETEDGVRTKAFDESKMTDPSLVIYNPVRRWNGRTIITNGDQTDTIVNCLQDGRGFHAALMSRTFEPDPPHYTPRISGLINPDGGYLLSIVKNIGGDSERPAHQMFEYSQPIAGTGHFIHTYSGGGDPLPSFEGEPRACGIPDKFGNFIADVCSALAANPNFVSVYFTEIDIESGESFGGIFNVNTEDKND